MSRSGLHCPLVQAGVAGRWSPPDRPSSAAPIAAEPNAEALLPARKRPLPRVRPVHRLRRFWRHRSTRCRILVACCAVYLLAGLAAASVTVVNARSAADVEMAAAQRVAERYVQEALARDIAALGATQSLNGVSIDPSALRHVRIHLRGPDGRIVSLARGTVQGGTAQVTGPDGGTAGERSDPAPAWFAALVAPDTFRTVIPIRAGGTLVGEVEINGEPADEIAEVWEDMTSLGQVVLFASVFFFGVLYLSLGSILRPLGKLSEGMQKLEAGQFGTRLAGSHMIELAAVAEQFNALAAALDAANAENARLSRRILSVQEEERRQVALDLHDEAGPCLFGIQANAASIAGLSQRCPAPEGTSIADRANTIAAIAERLQTMNRSLLRRLRPMALGNVPLADLVADLLADFERQAPDVRFGLQHATPGTRYGDPVDLTVYRCIQECLTNAIRHAAPRAITVTLEETRADACGSEARAPTWLRVMVADDGRGMAADAPRGYGLTGIDERVRALGGWMAVKGADGAGTRVEIGIPIEGTKEEESGRNGRKQDAASDPDHR